MKRFNGDLTKWVAFWDTFNSTVHSNSTLSDIDKFTYLHSLLDGSAADAIAGLTLSSANYEEALSTLKQRFGNVQLIVNAHMNSLLQLPSVLSHHDLKGLRRLYDSVEANVRGLRALGISTDSYGSLLTSVLMNKLPTEIRIVVSRDLTADMWSAEEVIHIVSRELRAREGSSLGLSLSQKGGMSVRKPQSTAASLLTGSEVTPHCVFCNQRHQSAACTTVKEVSARKEKLRGSGRCYVRLRRNHLVETAVHAVVAPSAMDDTTLLFVHVVCPLRTLQSLPT